MKSKLNFYGIFSCTPEINAQSKKALVQIIGLGVGITLNFAGWTKIAFWAISWLWNVVPQENGKFHYLDLENYDFAVYSNICFINNFFFNLLLFIICEINKPKINIQIIPFNSKIVIPHNHGFWVKENCIPHNTILWWDAILTSYFKRVYFIIDF